MAIALKRGVSGQLQQFQVEDVLQVDVIERLNSSGAIQVNSSMVAMSTITFNTWAAITASGTDTVAFDTYQKATVNLNDNATVTLTLSNPTGPGNFMLVLVQGATTPTTSITWSTTGSLYAPSGTVSFGTAAGAITIVALAFDGTNWYASSAEVSEVV